jgi:hypothetical protein
MSSEGVESNVNCAHVMSSEGAESNVNCKHVMSSEGVESNVNCAHVMSSEGAESNVNVRNDTTLASIVWTNCNIRIRFRRHKKTHGQDCGVIGQGVQMSRQSLRAKGRVAAHRAHLPASVSNRRTCVDERGGVLVQCSSTTNRWSGRSDASDTGAGRGIDTWYVREYSMSPTSSGVLSDVFDCVAIKPATREHDGDSGVPAEDKLL